MKQGKHYTNLILWIFLAAIIAYFGYNVASSLTEPLTTSTAIEYEAGAGCYTTGFVVRDEEILTSAYDLRRGRARRGKRGCRHRISLRWRAAAPEPHS